MVGTCDAHERGIRGEIQKRKPVRWPRRRWEGNIKIDLKGMGRCDWINVAWDTGQWLAVVNPVLPGR